MRVFLTRLYYDYVMKKTWKHASLEKVEHTDMQVTTRDGHPIPLRLYRPKNIENKKLPVLIFYHGGGFVIGSVKGYHNLLSALCDMNQCMVASMDYRLAPKHPYPVPMQDTLDVTEWLLKNADHILAENKFVFAGDSAGGNLAAVNAHAFSRQYKDRIKGQLLICPTTDRNEPPKPSYIENAKVLPLTAGMMDWFGDNYTKNAVDINDPGLYPYKNIDFTGQPPCLIYTAELDVLRDDGNGYAEKLKAAGVETLHVQRAGEVHNFPIGRNRTDNSQALAQIKDWLAERFAA